MLLITEIWEAEQSLGSAPLEKSGEEQSWERYFERLKESYVIVTRELEAYLGFLANTSRQVEDHLGKSCGDVSCESSADTLEAQLNHISTFRAEFQGRMEPEGKRKLELVLDVLGHEVCQ